MEEEISLREILEILWTGRYIIISVTLIAMLFSGLASFFVLQPTYETTSLVRFSKTGDNMASELNSFSETIKSNAAVKRVITKLNLDVHAYTVESVKRMINVRAIKDTSVIAIAVKGSNPQVITDIANLLAFELGARTEISDRSDKIVSNRNDLLAINDQIKVTQGLLSDAEQQLKDTPEKLVTTKSLSDDAYLSNKSLGPVQVTNEEINPVYSNLTLKISENKLNLVSLNEQKNNLEQTIKDNEAVIKQLENQINNEKLRAENSERLLGGFHAVFITPALSPSEPVGPRKMLNVAIAAVVGAMLSTFIVFIRQYWINSGKPAEQTAVSGNAAL